MMTRSLLLLSAAASIALMGAAAAQTGTKKLTNPTNKPPGQMMDGSAARGASSYTPGHEMKAAGQRGSAPGASGYAPGHAPSTTTTTTTTRAR